MSLTLRRNLARAVSHAAAVFVLAGILPANGQAKQGEGWPAYGGDAGGQRFSGSSQISKANLDKLHMAWTFHTHALARYNPVEGMPSFESTPVLSGDTLYLTSPYNVVFALDARTGSERWHYDPKVEKQTPGGIITSRGVALWPAGGGKGSRTGPCSQRVFEGTLDGRLIALDAHSGEPCQDFGNGGSVDMRGNIHYQKIGFYGMTSPPTVVGNVVICGSTVGDNQQVDIESGAVRGYDALTGKELWLWEPLLWAQSQKVRTGAGNTWSIISADPALGLVYLPTGSASPDMYGGMRPGDDRDADSVVALNAATGKKVWAFQVVHHNVWDYDIASQPILFTWRGNTPAIAITTKMGMIFLLDRRDGRPLVPVEERPVPQGGAPGEVLSPTQPFQNIPSLSPLNIKDWNESTYQRPAADQASCRAQVAKLRYDGIYTPPTLEGSIAYPGNLGGVNWGGAALDPTTGILYANTNRLASATRLVRRHGLFMLKRDLFGMAHGPANFVFHHLRAVCLGFALLVCLLDAVRRRKPYPGVATVVVALVCLVLFAGTRYYLRRSAAEQSKMRVMDHFGYELSPQRKSPYLIERHPLVDGSGFNCTPAPWGGVTAVNLNTLSKVWEKPLGSMIPGQTTGIVNFGGPIVTSTGLVIDAGAEDGWLRFFDAASGEELKKLPLPASGVATPMTYTLDGRQYVVIAAGGHGDGYSHLGDTLMAFAVK